jgi:hypothetical protein
MVSFGYVVYQAERTLAPAEQREADAQLGRRCAALAQLRHTLAKPARALRRQSGTSPMSRGQISDGCSGLGLSGWSG